jgi:hypothetical protein
MPFYDGGKAGRVVRSFLSLTREHKACPNRAIEVGESSGFDAATNDTRARENPDVRRYELWGRPRKGEATTATDPGSNGQIWTVARTSPKPRGIVLF